MQVKSIAECYKVEHSAILLTCIKGEHSAILLTCIKGEHSAILLTCIKRKSVFKTFVLSYFEWPLKTGFTVVNVFFLFVLVKVSIKLCIYHFQAHFCPN